ncbi:MAG: hypothetical protein S4CHLAM20_00360 [Chlamydiia bacterium]|nr:hypothetical protein [Chlamydiia bacterium]
MKENSHPEYRDVCFVDMSSGKKYICGSAVETSQTVEHEGKTYPSVNVSISSSSHPFFTGDSTFVDTEGRVDKFKKRYAAKAPSKPVAKEAKDEKKEEKKPSVKKTAVKKAPKK